MNDDSLSKVKTSIRWLLDFVLVYLLFHLKCNQSFQEKAFILFQIIFGARKIMVQCQYPFFDKNENNLARELNYFMIAFEFNASVVQYMTLSLDFKLPTIIFII